MRKAPIWSIMSKREELLVKFEQASDTISFGKSNLPETVFIYKTVKDKKDKEVQTNNYVSFNPEEDIFHIYSEGKAIDIQGKEFDWIFDALRALGSDVPSYTVEFMDDNIVVEKRSVICGVKLKNLPVLNNEEHWVFERWCTDVERTEDFDLNTPITGNIRLYARWIEV